MFFQLLCFNGMNTVRVHINQIPSLFWLMTLDYADVGFNACKDILTLNIERIVTNRVKFTNGYVPGSW